MSPTSTPASQGELFDAILTLTKVWTGGVDLVVCRVGQSASVSIIFPKGTSPSLMRAWKPLYAGHQTIVLLQQLCYGLFDLLISEEAVIQLARPSETHLPPKILPV